MRRLGALVCCINQLTLTIRLGCTNASLSVGTAGCALTAADPQTMAKTSLTTPHNPNGRRRP